MSCSGATSSAKAITAYSIASPPAAGIIDGNAKAISVTVPHGTDVTALVATFTTTGASVRVGSTIQVSGTTPNDFTNPVSYLVTAADGTSATYTVTVTVAASPAKAITAFSFTSPPAAGAIDEAAKTVSVAVPHGTDVTALVATFTTTGASVRVGSTIQVSGTTPNDFTNPVSYLVTAADGTRATYTVTVTVAASPAKAITAFSFASPAATGIIDEAAKTIAVIAPHGTDVTALVATFTTTGASVRVGSTVQVSGTTPNDFTNPVSYLVTAADGSTATYAVTVTAIAIDLPRTGQTACYDGAGGVISCATTAAQGQDGALQRGVAWPGPRFTVGAGAEVDCVTDALTGLMWVKAPDATPRTWQQALDYADGLTLCGHSDWQLPNRRELKSLVNYGQVSSAAWLNDPAQGFSGVQANGYWSSTTYETDTSRAWFVDMLAGGGFGITKSGNALAWPVRSGQVAAPAAVPRTGQVTSYGAGTIDDGALQRGVAWPRPRFAPGAGAEVDCVTDVLTGLVWIKAPDASPRTWQQALDYPAGLTLCGHSDWRLPNMTELESLVHAQFSGESTCNGSCSSNAAWLNSQGFDGVQEGLYWSSTTYLYGVNCATCAWNVDLFYLSGSASAKTAPCYAWPVRGGQ
jgi:uncharacterized protein YegL